MKLYFQDKTWCLSGNQDLSLYEGDSIFSAQPAKIPHFKSPLTCKQARWPHFFIAFFFMFISWMLITPSFKKSLIVEQFQGNYLKAETQDATNRGDTSHRLHCCCDKSFSLSLSLRYVARIQTSLNLCDRSQRQNSVAVTMVFTCHTRRFVAATCRGDVSQRFVAMCVSPLHSCTF